MKTKPDKRATRKGGYYDKKYASVTTVLKVLDKPALNNWMLKRVFEATKGGAQTLKEAKDQVFEKTQATMDLGTKAHRYVELYGTGEKMENTANIAGFIAAFHDWVIDFKPEFLIRELTVIHKEFAFGGTVDLVCKINGERCLVDVKTGRYIYPSVELQTTAYKMAYEVQEGKKIKKNYVLLLEKDSAGFPTGKYRFEELDYVPDIWEATVRLFYWTESLK